MRHNCRKCATIAANAPQLPQMDLHSVSCCALIINFLSTFFIEESVHVNLSEHHILTHSPSEWGYPYLVISTYSGWPAIFHIKTPWLFPDFSWEKKDGRPRKKLSRLTELHIIMEFRGRRPRKIFIVYLSIKISSGLWETRFQLTQNFRIFSSKSLNFRIFRAKNGPF